MRKRYLLLTLLTVWTAIILYGCGKGTDSDTPVSPSTSAFQDTPKSPETSGTTETLASQETSTAKPLPTPEPEPTPAPISELEPEQRIDLHPFSDVLGYKDYYITMEESTPHFYIWRFYTVIDGETQCLAETFGYDDLPNAYSTDLNGDGTGELIVNCTYGDGVEEVFIYRVYDGVIQQGYISIDSQTLENDYGISMMWSLAIRETYDPQEKAFVITGPSISDEEETISITLSYENCESFEFIPYKPLK